jgi:8-oxo-dGTP pyrophosphatase MutT (NUDIX family)
MLTSIEKHMARLSADEHERLLDQKAFTQLVGKIYRTRAHLIPKVMAGYKALYEKLKSFPSSGKVFEYGWSFPKGGADGEETRITVLRREIMEETGLQSGSYMILPIKPFKYDLVVNAYTFRSWIYFGELDQSVVFPTKGITLAPALRDMMPKPTASDEICEVSFVPLSEVRNLLPQEACDALKLALVDYVEYKSKRIVCEMR